MALLQLLLRFSATDHGDCHFREESLEKLTVLTSKRRKPGSTIDLLSLLSLQGRWAGARRAASLSAFRYSNREF